MSDLAGRWGGVCRAVAAVVGGALAKAQLSKAQSSGTRYAALRRMRQPRDEMHEIGRVKADRIYARAREPSWRERHSDLSLLQAPDVDARTVPRPVSALQEDNRLTTRLSDGGWVIDRDVSWQRCCMRHCGQVEFPFPALVAADLHVVVSRVPCPVTCAPCWAALCAGGSNPALPAAHQEVAGFSPPARGCARLRDDYLLHPGSVTPGDRTASWTAGCARRPRGSAGPGRRPANAAAPPAGR